MDVIATVLLSLLALGVAAAVLFASPFLLMATDSAAEKADLKPLGRAYAVTWGGVAVGLLGGAVGIFRAARLDTTMWIWPALAIAVIGGCFAVGGRLATRVARKPD